MMVALMEGVSAVVCTERGGVGGVQLGYVPGKPHSIIVVAIRDLPIANMNQSSVSCRTVTLSQINLFCDIRLI